MIAALRNALFVVAAPWCCGAGVAQPPAPEEPAGADAGTTSVCIECHATLDGPLSQAVADWRASSHGRNGIGCVGCHRGDPTDERNAKSPAEGFIAIPRLREVPYVCGRCHQEITEKHLASPHGALGLPHCVTCHGAHTVREPDPNVIISEDACTKCHEFEAAEKAQEALTKARELLVEVDELTEQIRHIPAVEEHLETAQREMRLDRAGVLAVFHSFRIGEIERIGMNVDRLRKTLTRLQQREVLREKNIARERPLILALMAFIVVATAFGFAVYRHKGEVEPGK